MTLSLSLQDKIYLICCQLSRSLFYPADQQHPMYTIPLCVRPNFFLLLTPIFHVLSVLSGFKHVQDVFASNEKDYIEFRLAIYIYNKENFIFFHFFLFIFSRKIKLEKKNFFCCCYIYALKITERKRKRERKKKIILII